MRKGKRILLAIKESSDDWNEWKCMIRVSCLLLSKGLMLCLEIETKINRPCERKRRRWNWSNFFKKWYLQSLLIYDHSQIITLSIDYITQVYFTHNLFTNNIVIFKIWMNNWKMILANLELVVRKEKCLANGMT